MKRLPAAYSIFILLGPLLVIAALMAGPFGCGSSSSPVAAPTVGTLEIGLVDSPSTGYQAISLNIVSVRVNPSSNPNVPDSDANWKVITAPPGSSVATGGILNVNLLDFQTSATVFNTGRVLAQEYLQFELVVDSTYPGTVTPSCTSGAFEGCVSYPLTFSGTTNLRTTGSVDVTPAGLATLIIDINPGLLTPPSSPGGGYVATPTISQVTSAGFLGTVTGTVAGVTKNSVASVTAVITGTNQVIATTPVQASGTYTIALPAVTTLGTTYDLFAGGTTTANVFSGSATFDAISGVTVMHGVSPITEPFSVTAGPSTGTVSGTIYSTGPGTVGQGIPGATINLLRTTTETSNCQATMGAGCVVVLSTSSDSAGSYALASVPFGVYYVEVQATGANTVIQQLTVSSKTISCVGSPDSSNCSFNLPNAVIGGTITVEPPPSSGNSASVIVLAEQHGTGNLVGATSVTVRSSLATPYTIQVPTVIGTDTSPTFDLIASAQDTYLGIGSAFTGHNQAVLADIAGGATNEDMTVECLGHGTIAGLVANPDPGSQVVLFQNASTSPPPVYVQLQNSTVGQTGSAFPGQYSFCAPPGNDYFVRRFEQTGPTSSPTAINTPQGPISVATPAPAPSASLSPGATPTPCPVCQNTDGQCPGNCTATTASPL